MNSHKTIGTVALALALGGCALGPAATPEVLVQARAEASWQALLAGKFEDAYKYAAPSFRQEVTLDQYRSSFGGAIRWVGADVTSVVCEPHKCLAKMSITVPSPVPHQFSGNITTRLDETWVFEDNQWWVVPKR